MASSRYGAEIERKQQGLIELLVTRLVPTQPGDPKLLEAANFCQYHFKYHRFADTDPNEVEGLFRSLSSRLVSESQITKADALSLLKEEFLNVEWQSHAQDIHHAVLRMLFYLANRPVDSQLPRGIANRLRAARGDVSIAEREASVAEELSDWGDEGELCASDSELSYWTGDEEDVPNETRPTTSRGAQDEIYRAGSVVGALTYYASRGATTTAARPVKEDVQLTRGSLFEKLFWTKNARPPQVFDRKGVRTETEVVNETIRALQGIQGDVFKWDDVHGRFRIWTSIQTPHLSASCLQSLLENFARTATSVRTVKNWAKGVVRSSSQLCSGCAPVSQGAKLVFPTLAAFAHSLLAQLNKVIRPIVKFEQQLSCAPASQQPPSLVFVKGMFDGVFRKVALLHQCLEAVKKSLDEPELTPCFGRKTVLDTLCNMLDDGDMAGGPSGHSSQVILWKLFAGSLQPLLSDLTIWLFLGESTDLSEEFFISKEQNASLQLSEFWLHGFPVDSGACPNFLSFVCEDVLEGGKALHILRSSEYEDKLREKATVHEMKDFLTCLVERNWTSNLMHNEFTKYLGQILSEMEGQEQLVDSGSIFESMALAGHYRSGCSLPECSGIVVPWVFQPPLDSDEDTERQQIMESAPEVLELEQPGSVGESLEDVERAAVVGQSEGSIEMDCESNASRNELSQHFVERLQAMNCLDEEIRQCTTTDTTLQPASGRYTALARVLPHPTYKEPYDGCVLGCQPERPSTTESTRPLPDSCGTSPPLSLILDHGLLEVIQKRSKVVVRSLLQCLLEELGMAEEFTMLSNIYFLGSPAMIAWVQKLCGKLNAGSTVPQLREYEVVVEMQECFNSFNMGEPLPMCQSCGDRGEMFVQIQSSGVEGVVREAGWMERSLQEVDYVHVLFPVTWPLCMVVNHPTLKRYNEIFTFLMKLEWVTLTLDSAWRSLVQLSALEGDILYTIDRTMEAHRHVRSWRNVHCAIGEMMHLVKNLKQYVLTNSHSAFQSFKQGLCDAESVQEVQDMHYKMLDNVHRVCFCAQRKQWKTVKIALLKFLHEVLNIATVLNTMAETVAAISKLIPVLNSLLPKYAEARHGFLMMLQMYNNTLGGSIELEHLISILNFNDFYPQYTPTTTHTRKRAKRGKMQKT